MNIQISLYMRTYIPVYIYICITYICIYSFAICSFAAYYDRVRTDRNDQLLDSTTDGHADPRHVDAQLRHAGYRHRFRSASA